MEAHRRSLLSFGLEPPRGPGSRCGQCVNRCEMAEGERGACGLRVSRSGRVLPVLHGEAVVDYYFDPLPTNCVAEWVCPATGPESKGKKNLAVFFSGCTFDCLFCQNWHHRTGAQEFRPRRSVEQLIEAVDADTFCVCFFGGDPTPQLEFALLACDSMQESEGSSPRLCWETNGSMSADLAERMADSSYESQGIIKIDLKALNENLHIALCGTSNRNTLSNFSRIARRTSRRPQIVASTLLVPGYVDEHEVGDIAAFIADIDEDIPYSLLAFHPDYLMTDLPATSRRDALAAEHAARKVGLSNVRVGNLHLLI